MKHHTPCMVQPVLEMLRPEPGSIYLDGTLGTAGHAREIAMRVQPDGTVVGLDRDPEILAIGRQRMLEEFAQAPLAMHFFSAPYEQAAEALRQAGIKRGVDCALCDLGINSLQLDDPERGFSFSKDGPLDGRFNQEERTATVGDLVNNATERELSSWLRDYADERYARQIARAIVNDRRERPYTRTGELAALISNIYPPKERFGRTHPATRTFQALRIAANDELGGVSRGLRVIMDTLAPGGVLAVLTFHSIEDRIVKHLFKDASSPRPDPDNPYSATTMEGVEFELVGKGAIECSDEEAEVNPRSRSAKLRGIRRKGGAVRA